MDDPVDFEAIYALHTKPEEKPAESAPATEPPTSPPTSEEKPAEPAAVASAEVKTEPAKPTPTDEKPFQFEEDRLYPVPGKDGIEWVPYKKFKRYVEQGRGAEKLVKEYKTKEERLKTPIAIHESVSDLPEPAREKLFAELTKLVEKVRSEAGLPQKLTPKPVAELPPEYKGLLDKYKNESEQRERYYAEQKVLTKMDGNVKELVSFAKDHFGHEIDNNLGEQIRANANKLAEQLGVPLEQVDLIGVYTRLVPAHLRAGIKNQMELEGKTAPQSKPTVAPKASPSPRIPSGKKKEKLEDYSQAELEALSKDERDALVHKQLVSMLGS